MAIFKTAIVVTVVVGIAVVLIYSFTAPATTPPKTEPTKSGRSGTSGTEGFDPDFRSHGPGFDISSAIADATGSSIGRRDAFAEDEPSENPLQHIGPRYVAPRMDVIEGQGMSTVLPAINTIDTRSMVSLDITPNVVGDIAKTATPVSQIITYDDGAGTSIMDSLGTFLNFGATPMKKPFDCVKQDDLFPIPNISAECSAMA